MKYNCTFIIFSLLLNFTEEVKVFTLFTGNKNALQRTHKNFIATLQNQIPNLREVDTLDESDVTLIICPNASRVGTDIDAALKRFEDNKGCYTSLSQS